MPSNNTLTIKKVLIGLIFSLTCQITYGQLGDTCGIPQWNDTIGYSTKSVVFHNSIVYTNTIWSDKGKEPSMAEEETNWNSLGLCNEQLIIDNPSLAYTDCKDVNS